MSDGRVRLFVALELPEPVREALTRWRDGVLERDRSVRPVAAEALHVTLCFLGWRAEDEIEPIAAACDVVRSNPAPTLRLGDPLWLPRRRPRVLAVELADTDRALARVQAVLSDVLSAGGWYEPEKRPYLAHVTLARVRGTPVSGVGAARRSAGRSEPPPAPRLTFDASRIVLYRSRLSPSGARYEPLATLKLAGDSPRAGDA